MRIVAIRGIRRIFPFFFWSKTDKLIMQSIPNNATYKQNKMVGRINAERIFHFCIVIFILQLNSFIE